MKHSRNTRNKQNFVLTIMQIESNTAELNKI